MKLKVALSAALLAASTAAWAFHCPADMAKIDDALAQNPELTAEQLQQVKQWRAEGEELHVAGNHQAAVDTLARAMATLGI